MRAVAEVPVPSVRSLLSAAGESAVARIDGACDADYRELLALVELPEEGAPEIELALGLHSAESYNPGALSIVGYVILSCRSAAKAPMTQNMPVALSLMEAPQKVGGSSGRPVSDIIAP